MTRIEQFRRGINYRETDINRPVDYPRDIERMKARNVSRGDRALAIYSGPGEETLRMRVGTGVLLQGRDEQLKVEAQDILKNSKLRQLATRAFGGTPLADEYLGEKGPIAYLENTLKRMDDPYRRGSNYSAVSRVGGKLNPKTKKWEGGNYAVSVPTLTKMLERIPPESGMNPKQREFFAAYRSTIDSLIASDPLTSTQYAINRKRSNNPSEQTISNTVRLLAAAGAALITLVSLLKGKPSLVTVLGIGATALLLNPKLFAGKIEKMSAKLNLLQFPDFQRLKSGISPALAREIWNGDTALLKAIKKSRGKHFGLQSDKQFTEEHIAEFKKNGLRKGSALDAYIRTKSASDVSVTIELLERVRGGDELNREAQIAVEVALKENMSATRIGSDLAAMRKAARGAVV